MKALSLFTGTLFSKTPSYVILYVTSQCNARCKMCYNWKRVWNPNPAGELSVDEIKRIFKSFSRIQQLTLSGGEPFMRKNLVEIIEFVSWNNQCRGVTIPTTGILTELVTKQTKSILEVLPEHTQLKISLSLHHLGVKHDTIVGVQGAFKKLHATFEKLSELRARYDNLSVRISTTAMTMNKDVMGELLTYCNDTFDDCTVHLGVVRGPTPTPESGLSTQEFKDIVDHFNSIEGIQKNNMPLAKIGNCVAQMGHEYALKAMEEKKQPIKCRAAQTMVAIQSDGEVYPCDALEKSLGNLRDYDYDIRRMSREPHYQQVQQSIREGECHCTSACGFLASMPFDLKANVRFAWKLFRSR